MDHRPAPRILFVLNRVLGWKTYADAVARVVAERGTLDAQILFLEPGLLQRALVKHHRSGGLRAVLKRLDPITAYQGAFGRLVRRRIREHRPDLVHFAPHWPAASVLSLPRPVRFTAALDSTRPSMARALGDPGLWSARDREREAGLARRAVRLFPWSRWTAASLSADYGVDPTRMRVIPPSIHAAPETQGRGTRRSSGDGPLRILFVGNDFSRKGGDRLLRWVRDRLPGVCELHIASSDPRAAIRQPGVICHGAVPNHRLREALMPRMDVLCHPTRSDMSAYVVVEAASAGLPCVASAIGGIPDLVEHGRTGFLVAPDDEEGFVGALGRLAASRPLLDAMGAAARDHARRFDARANYGEMLDELVALAAGRV